jgi:N-acetylglucosaminyldiphosphoundecaprenol N-acetyl-beta-D-mannosaminyltransferase
VRTDELIDLLIERAAAGVRTTAAYLNAHTVNLAQDDPDLDRALRACDLLYADGASIVLAGRLLGAALPERMTSADYFPSFAERCARRGLSLYLLGGAPGVAAFAAARLSAEVPGLEIVGAHDGFFPDAGSLRVCDEINAARPDVLVIGMGTPRQQRWAVEHADRLRPPLRWCVGALFDYLAGVEPRAPRWLCRVGLEWLHRLLHDPAGKWRRYLLGNPRFAWHALRARAMQGRQAPAAVTE